MDKIIFASGSSGINGAHSTETALRCLRLYALKNIQHVDFGLREPLVAGSIAHVGLAQRYARMWAEQNGEDPEAFYSVYDALPFAAEEFGDFGLSLLPGVVELLHAYELYWKNEKLKVMHVEEVFEAQIADYTHTQRLDLGVGERDGKVYFYDHKRVGRISKDTLTRYTLSVQFIGYQYLGRKYYGREFGGVKANFLAHSPVEFKRLVIDPAPDALAFFENTVIEARERVARWKDVPPAQWPKALSEQTCVTSYGICDAFSTCQWGTSSALAKLKVR